MNEERERNFRRFFSCGTGARAPRGTIRIRDRPRPPRNKVWRLWTARRAAGAQTKFERSNATGIIVQVQTVSLVKLRRKSFTRR